MHNAKLTSECGLFPSDIAEVSIRCVEDDLFCWVMGPDNSVDRLIALPSDHEDAQFQLASTLEKEHQFGTAPAALTAQTLFADAFRGIEPFVPHSDPAVIDLVHLPT